jgi:hypothetical protein
MSCRSFVRAVAFAAMLLAPIVGARAQDQSKYPDWRGQWVRASPVQWDPSKPAARGQQAPLTAEYQALYDRVLAEQVAGGQDYNPQVRCLPAGLPRGMIAYEPMELVVTPDTTYMRLVYMSELRRIYTDGRDWPANLEPSYTGTSIGRWVDEDGTGRFDVLEVETRGFKGPRVFDNTGIPLHQDNASIIKERIYLDKAKPDILHDQVTVVDHALTRPWTVTRSYQRQPVPAWAEYVCGENNNIVNIGNHSYYVNWDGNLMPMEKDEPAPDLRNFDQPRR